VRTSTAERLDWRDGATAIATVADRIPQPEQAPMALPLPEPEPEPPDLAACLSGPHGLDLVVELAHDLRSPLTSILFLAESLQQGQGGPVTPEQSRQLGLVYSAALCLCATASDVLELARGGQRLVDRAPAPFSVAEVFASVRSMILPIAEEKRLDVRVVHPVPERRTGHERALSRVLLNLATNAVKFTDSGFVEIAALPVGARRLEFSVRDTGHGIDAARLRTLFQPVRRPPATQREHFSSSGLGLTICRKLVRAMGSELQIETRPQWGTRFYFEVDAPVAPAAA
jgi:signal transduction histidine kinase